MVRIPSEYQEVEYLESTGTKKEWINTDIIPNKDMRVVVHGITRQDIQSASFIFGSRTTNNSKMFCGLIWRGKYEFELGNRRNENITKANAGERFYYDFNCDENHRVIANGVAYPNPITITDSESQYTLPMLLFAIYTGTSIDYQRALVRISNFVVYESYADTNPIQNLIPCYRKSDNEIGMYDTVTGTFFTNQGTGTFLKGNDVTYDNINLLESRRRILLNTPHLESLSGSILSFETDMASKLKECRIYFTPIQEGTGDPSPDNVRPIVGWDGVTVNHNNNSLTIPFPQTIYGGYVDLVKGEVVETHYLDVLSETVENLSADYNTETTVFFRCQLSNNVSSPSSNSQIIEDAICENLKYRNTTIWSKPTTHVNQITKRYNNNGRVCMVMYNTVFDITSEDSLAEKKQKIDAYLFENQIRFAYKLATPNTYPLDPVTIKTLKGLNNIWSDANGNVEVKFWTH